MPTANEQVAALLREYADLVLISGGDAVRARAYEKAARAVDGYSDDVSRLRRELRDLRGFGPKSEERILHGIAIMATAGQRVHLNVAMETATEIVEAISPVPGCVRCGYAGSLRRMRETIGDIDILAAADASGPLMQKLTSLPVTREVIASGDTKTSIRTTAGLQVDLRVVPPDCWGAALQYFTGSQAHNVRVREVAVRKKLKLSEYGLFDTETGALIVSATEEDVYRRLGMAWVPPALREDSGEVQAALRGELPVPGRCRSSGNSSAKAAKTAVARNTGASPSPATPASLATPAHLGRPAREAVP